MNADTLRCYRTLEVKPGAPRETIKQAYRELVKIWHPDRFPDEPKLQHRASEKLKQINLAYEFLQALADSGGLPTEVVAEASPDADLEPSNQGSPPVMDGRAMFELGQRFYQGDGAEPDFAEAFKWYQRAADHGVSQAHVALGYLYLHGEGTPKDEAQALNRWQTAAEQANADAQFCLGCLYSAGFGANPLVNKLGSAVGLCLCDTVEAYKWFHLSALNGNRQAVGGRENLATSMTRAQIAQARRLVARRHPPYPGKSASDILKRLARLYLKELREGTDQRNQSLYQQAVSSCEMLDKLVSDIADRANEVFCLEFLAEPDARPAGWIKDVGAGLKRRLFKKKRSDHAKLIARQMLLDSWQFLSDDYSQAKENALHQLWLQANPRVD